MDPGSRAARHLGCKVIPKNHNPTHQNTQVSADTYTHAQTHGHKHAHTHTHNMGMRVYEYTCLVAALQLDEIPLATRKQERNKGGRPVAARLDKKHNKNLFDC